jgi:hypothetical protein
VLVRSDISDVSLRLLATILRRRARRDRSALTLPSGEAAGWSGADRTVATMEVRVMPTTKTRAGTDPEVIDVPERLLLIADGRGDPNGNPAYQRATQALFSMSYAIRFHLKRDRGVDRPVGPLEGFWSIDGGVFSYTERSNWIWTIGIEQPEEATPELVEKMATEKGIDVPIRLERIREGRAAQVLHIGPFAEEPATIERLDAFIESRGLRQVGRHHEIYLSDPRKAAPERLRTIIRHAVM